MSGKVRVSKALDKQIDYVQTAIKQDIKNANWDKRSIKEINELTSLIVDQYKDNKNTKVKTKDTVSIEEVEIAVGIDGNNVWNKYSKTR